jgi:hypothetical protein
VSGGSLPRPGHRVRRRGQRGTPPIRTAKVGVSSLSRPAPWQPSWPTAEATGRRRPATAPLSPAGAIGRPGASSQPGTPPWGRWGPSRACRPSCPCRCRRRRPPRRALGYVDRSRGRRPADARLARPASFGKPEQPPRPGRRWVGPVTRGTRNRFLRHVCADDRRPMPPQATGALASPLSNCPTPAYRPVPPTRPTAAWRARPPPPPRPRRGLPPSPASPRAHDPDIAPRQFATSAQHSRNSVLLSSRIALAALAPSTCDSAASRS